MRKVILVFMAVGLLGLAMADLVSAAQEATITISVTCRKLSVGVTTTTYGFSTVNESSETVASTPVGVTNDGNVTETFELKLTNPADWTAVQSGTPGADQYILGAIFKFAAPVAGDYTESEDMLSTSYVAASTTVFAKTGDTGQFGNSVAASGNRNLWFYFFAPLTTGLGTEHSITVTVKATAS